MAFDPDARLAQWRTSLLDTTKRNRLIKFVAGRVGGLNLLHPLAGELWARLVCDGGTLAFPWKRDLLGLRPELLDAETLAADYDPNRGHLEPGGDDLAREWTELALRSPRLRANHLLTPFTDRQLAARLTHLERTAREAETDHGVTTLYAAFGLLRWFEGDDSDEELLSPLLLVPIRLDRRTCESEFTLRAEDDEVLPNHCLAELMRSRFRIRLPAAEECVIDPDDPGCVAAYRAAVADRVKQVPRWSVHDSAALGVFNFQKLAMWEDLGRNAERVKAHPVCRAIAGDTTVSLKPPDGLPAAADLDHVIDPAATAHILDADSSQHEAVEAVKRGAHLVMDGPPGTGKSQTIANMIAEALAAGKTVLFVSEKTAALDVVKRRLDRCGLGDFCLELHSHRARKKEVVAELGRCLGLAPTGPPDVAESLRQLADHRARLNEFVAALHAVRLPFGWSAYRVHGELARLDRVSGRSRVAIPGVFTKDAEYVRRGAGILAGLADCGAVIGERGGHPWQGCKLTSFSHTARDDAAFHMTRLGAATPAAERAAAGLAGSGVGAEPFTVPGWRSAENDARGVVGLPVFPAAWLAGDPRSAANSVLALDTATRAARELVARLPEFDQAAVRGVTNPAEVLAHADRERLIVAGTLTARERLGLLRRVGTSLRKAHEQAVGVEVLARDLGRQLHLATLPAFEQLGELARLAAHLAQSPPMPLRWWDAPRRAELVTAVARAGEDDRAADALRPALVTKFSPVALSPESSVPARAAAEAADSMWRWLPWSQWAKVRTHVQAWHPAGTPPRADLAELAAYHRRKDAARQVAEAYRGEWFGDGSPDWAATAEGLSVIDRLLAWSPGAEFRKAAGPGGSLDREALRLSAEQLGAAVTEFDDHWRAVLKDFVPAAGGVSSAMLEEEAAAVDKEAAALDRVVALLAPGKDLPPTTTRERIADLAGLIDARERIRSAAAVLGDAHTPEELEAADHAPPAALARQLLGFLDGWSRPIPPPLVAALTDPEARERLRAAVARSEAARAEFDRAWDRVTADLFDPDAEVSTRVVLNKTALARLREWATARAADANRLSEWARFVQVARESAAFGIGEVLHEVNAGEFRPDEAADAFRARFYRLWLDELHRQVPVLGSFTTEAHERVIARFAELDRLAIRATPNRVRSRLLTQPNRPHVTDGAPEASELGILLREVHKKRRHLPLRRLFAQIPTILPRLKPCLMMSPLAVSTYLDTQELHFDLVIFDEASQVRPHDAVCAIYRGDQLVVGGDPKQLPPTDFFTRTVDDGDGEPADDGGTVGFESLLDVCLALGLTRKRLRWHYRSRREALIAFSNRYFYDGRLVTFPSADEAAAPAVGFVKVPDGRFTDGVNPIEARRVAELVMQHARTNPGRSLGVIAFSQRQQDRILDELEVLRRQTPDAEAFFADDREDPFFVKNLENVQGDERDAILLSVGYGPDEAGRVAMRFGPLNRQGGERRLNVAVTRARWAMTVVASISAGDIDLSRTGAEGAKLLKAFLDYAERGQVALADATPGDDRGTDSPFEQEVGDELARRGVRVHRQVGCGGYLIDLAVADPQQGGKYLLGVECDGATYHAAATARDRDRLRQSVLEGLGWRLVRVWSTDWVRDREKQVRRVMAALAAAQDPLPTPPEPEMLPVPRWKPPKRAVVVYDSIEAVPDDAVTAALVAVLTVYGSMPAEDLIATGSKRLGFKRTGPKIRDRIAAGLNALAASGRVTIAADTRVRLAAP